MSHVLVLQHAAELVAVGHGNEQQLSGAAMCSPSIIPDGSVVIEGEHILWVGPSSQLPPFPSDATVIDCRERIVLPGFVDSHTHLIFAGSREDEFEQRLLGRSYQEIAAAGGGILSSVRTVRTADREQLKALARPRLRRLLEHGVTTVEVKSGYGLSLADELKCLEAIADLNAEGPLELVPTFLGAHAVPAEYRHDRAAYVRLLCDSMLPEVARCRLAQFCDVFCETGVFSLEETETIFTQARALGLELRLHADELTPLGGAELAVRMGAASADHLLRVTPAGIEALARSNTVATLLPGTAFFLGAAYAPARRLIDGGATVALASDCNPGTCPTENLPLVGTMACTQMKMIPSEVVTALTLNAAASLQRSDRIGSLLPRKQADLIVCDVPNVRRLFYHYGINHVSLVIKKGVVRINKGRSTW